MFCFLDFAFCVARSDKTPVTISILHYWQCEQFICFITCKYQIFHYMMMHVYEFQQTSYIKPQNGYAVTSIMVMPSQPKASNRLSIKDPHDNFCLFISETQTSDKHSNFVLNCIC